MTLIQHMATAFLATKCRCSIIITSRLCDSFDYIDVMWQWCCWRMANKRQRLRTIWTRAHGKYRVQTWILKTWKSMETQRSKSLWRWKDYTGKKHTSELQNEKRHAFLYTHDSFDAIVCRATWYEYNSTGKGSDSIAKLNQFHYLADVDLQQSHLHAVIRWLLCLYFILVIFCDRVLKSKLTI